MRRTSDYTTAPGPTGTTTAQITAHGRQRRKLVRRYVGHFAWMVSAASLTHLVLAALFLAPVSAGRHLSDAPPEGDVDQWISRMFEPRPVSEATESPSKTRPLCYAGPQDLQNEIRGEVKVGGEPLGEPFTAVQIGKFPYASEHHCDEVSDSIHFVPDNCELTPFEPTAFLEQIAGRRFIFWGDSVTRQFFSYLTLRLRRFQKDTYDFAGKSGELPLADEETCHFHADKDSEGLQISRACLHLAPLEDWGKNCFHYPDFSAEICYVRSEKVTVDNRNVVFWNSLKPEDILFINTGLHHNTRFSYRYQMSVFTNLVQITSTIRKLPLMLWRDTSAQHFSGGEGGNFPPEASEALRFIDPDFQCTQHSFDVMKLWDWRNRILHLEGFVAENLRMKVQTFSIWNVTAMSAAYHPYVLGAKGQVATSVADCTHYCPTYGGMYEVWSNLLQNYLAAAHPYDETLKVEFIFDRLDYEQFHTNARRYEYALIRNTLRLWNDTHDEV